MRVDKQKHEKKEKLFMKQSNGLTKYVFSFVVQKMFGNSTVPYVFVTFFLYKQNEI